MKALVTGITGQDGYYLTDFLIKKGYQVHGIIRRSSSFNTSRIDPLISTHAESGALKLYYSDLIDSSSISNLVNLIQPDEIYNLAAQSHVAVSFKNPAYTSQVALGTVSLLESVKNSDKKIKFYQASSSEMYGGEGTEKLDELSILNPKSPYAASKVFAHHLTKIYRESYELFCVNGILFNHESPLRGETFVTRKITRAVGRISMGLQSKLTLGNLDSFRDWGFAGDYVKGMWLMLQHDIPQDWVLASGKTYSVRDFVKLAFQEVNLDWEEFVEIDQKYFRPNEVDHLLGSPERAMKDLGWKPETSFEDLVKMMIESDLKIAEQEKVLIANNLLTPTWEYPAV